MAAKQPEVPWFRYWNEPPSVNPKPPFQVDDACIEAMRALHPTSDGGLEPGHFGGNIFATNPDKHPDARIIREWLASIDRDARELQIIFWFAFFVCNEWANFPKRRPNEHDELFESIATLCHELRDAMDRTEMPFKDGIGHGLKHMHVSALLKDFEMDCVVSAYDHARSRQNGWPSLTCDERRLVSLFLSLGFPTMQVLLDRVANEAQRLQKQGPLHTQPSKRGANRGYFVRRAGEMFQRRYGEQPHEVIAALATIALGEATGRELVGKLLA